MTIFATFSQISFWYVIRSVRNEYQAEIVLQRLPTGVPNSAEFKDFDSK